MQIQIASPVSETIFFAAVFLPALFIFLKRITDRSVLSLTTSNELKGLAILMVVFSHIGYFLSADTRFLYSFSAMAGVGVNLFLFLSGFGLATSTCRRGLSALDCYRQRILRLFIPLWICLTTFFILDWLILAKTYSAAVIIQSFAGFFASADIFNDLNSPLWYFTLIFFYYLIFPLLFEKKHPFISAALMLLASYFILSFSLPVDWIVLKLYKLHLWAFPLGVAFAGLMLKPGWWSKFFPTKFEKIIGKLKKMETPVRLALIAILGALVYYFFRNSGIGESIFKEQAISIVTTAVIIGVFLLKKIEFRLLYWFGLFSFEIYLWHWPLLYRYDFLYNFLPAGIATLIYLSLFLALGHILKKIETRLPKVI